MSSDSQNPAVTHPLCICAALRLALEIRALNRNDTPVTFSVLKERLAPEMGRNTVSNALDEVGDWGIAEGHYGPLGDGRAGYCYMITEHAAPLLNNLAEEFRAGKVVYIPEVADARQ